MQMFDIIFYLFAFITIGSALIVVTARNIIYSAFSLMLTLFGVSGIYALLGADFLAVVQIMVYVGGILVLILFGVMLTNKIVNIEIKTGNRNIAVSLISVSVLSAILFSVLLGTNWKETNSQIPETTLFGIGELLITKYVLVFELLGILLLIALIGAATIARKEE